MTFRKKATYCQGAYSRGTGQSTTPARLHYSQTPVTDMFLNETAMNANLYKQNRPAEYLKKPDLPAGGGTSDVKVCQNLDTAQKLIHTPWPYRMNSSHMLEN